MEVQANVIAAQVVRLEGPDGIEIRDVPEPATDSSSVVVDVHASGLAFPDLLLSQGATNCARTCRSRLASTSPARCAAYRPAQTCRW